MNNDIHNRIKMRKDRKTKQAWQKMRLKTKSAQHTTDAASGKVHKLLPFSMPNNYDNRTEILRIKEIIDKTTNTIFISYKKDLLCEPITYIIPAVWGKIKQGRLTTSQKEIYSTIDSMIKNIMEILELEELNDAQIFAIEYFIRGLVISKIAYLIEAFKNRSKEEAKQGEDGVNLCDHLRVS
ncbi:MAG: hypothetical protein JW944_03585 [Deltaproteobacteria bacterium]|nr:hypothetical protein [Deltaproteobacteria bacterium]